MELFFLAVLILLMIFALISGFPVAFSLPGAAILSIGLAAFCGYLFEGNASAYFMEGGPVQWLSAGVTNFRSLYWDVERDTLIAIPLFIFMGIMLQRSRVAEDLLVAMAQLFGSVPGGLGISVVLVGALLAATTGIVGATVIAMGMISLPAMLRNNYSKPLATGTICASGTLGQIIPPSIVLIILADQLSNATDQASTERQSAFKTATGEFSMPSVLDITSTSAGEMFMGALLPGLVLVGLYVAYILVVALLRPGSAPPVPYDGKYDRQFIFRVILALVPPLALIFVVLGSIILGIATVNQAGAIGAIGAIIMGGYRLTEGQKNTYYPAILAFVSILILVGLISFFDLNIKSIDSQKDVLGIFLASLTVLVLLVAICWSIWRVFKIEKALNEVMIETAKTTSMVFIILIGAAMLTSAFRGFGGEELVKEFLGDLPGGFWAQFIVVMAVIFLLGFFLDFIEIAVVVVPIVAPILLADPAANVTAVWLGVMVGLNIQTSFLTPPFGFALFYLRGVSPPEVETLHIYRGAVPFIGLQLLALVIVGASPSLVNYLPNRTTLTAETAPPPMNPKLQACLEEQIFDYYDIEEAPLRNQIQSFKAMDVSFLPETQQTALMESTNKALNTFELVQQIRETEATLQAYIPEYRPLHQQVRSLESQIRGISKEIEDLKQLKNRLSREEQIPKSEIDQITQDIEVLETSQKEVEQQIPSNWKATRQRYTDLANAAKKARLQYRNNADQSYETIAQLQAILQDTEKLVALEPALKALESVIANESPKEAMNRIRMEEKALGAVQGAGSIKSRFSRARRALKGNNPNFEKAKQSLQEGLQLFDAEVEWRRRAVSEFLTALNGYHEAIKGSIGIRMQEKLPKDLAIEIASCRSSHLDVSLQF